MDTERMGGYISKVFFNNGDLIEVQQNDIIIFVGPNNAGKSQSLKDIYTLSSKKVSTVVVSDIEISKKTGSLVPLLETIAAKSEQGSYTNYSVLGRSVNYWENSSDQSLLDNPYYGDYRDLFIANLDTAARLTICVPPNSINRKAAKQHPIHYAAFDGKYREWLSDSFKKAFGNELTPNILYGSTIPLCIGEAVKLGATFENEQQRLEAYADILEQYEQVQEQGDGIKSFTGILLYLMLDYYCTYLIDEPESFLHPPQARIMGQIIGQTLTDNQQAFISTHSEEIIKGLLEVCPERIKIVRITREGNNNSFSVLNNEMFSKVWSDPLLKYSNIMSSLFHKTVVLCESDSDCKMYSIIADHLKQAKGQFSESLFIHCGGKHRMAKISSALLALNIDVRLIPDIDILNDEKVFKETVEAFSVDWETIQGDYHILVSNLHSPKESVDRNSTKTMICSIFDASTAQILSDQEIKDIRKAISTVSKWSALKTSGVAAIPAGDATGAFRRIDQTLREKGIFIVPVGELEGFIKEVGGHGPEWVNKVFETFPNFNADEYSGVRQFISEVNL